MKFERSKNKETAAQNTECYRKFLAGNKTLYTKAFWENGPRRGDETSVSSETTASESKVEPSRN